eukprot:ctg_1369.g255
MANPLDHTMCDYHPQHPYRRLSHQHRRNEQRSHDWMRSCFQTRYGKPSKSLVLFGDWDTRDHHRKGSSPTKGMRIWELLEKCGYDMPLVDEVYTNKRCPVCEGEEGAHSMALGAVSEHGVRVDTQPEQQCHTQPTAGNVGRFAWPSTPGLCRLSSSRW